MDVMSREMRDAAGHAGGGGSSSAQHKALLALAIEEDGERNAKEEMKKEKEK